MPWRDCILSYVSVMYARWLETLVMAASVHVILNPLAGTHARAPEDLPQQLAALFKAQGMSPA